jgi:hypothetical protein
MYFGALLWLLLLLPAPVPAAQTAAETPKVNEEPEAETAADADDAEQDAGSKLDRHKRFMDTQVQSASRWIDGFFVDSIYREETSNNQLRVRPELYYRNEQGAEVKTKLQARIQLPNLGHRISLLAGAAEDDVRSDEFANADNQNKMAGLQFLLSESDKWHTSIVAGFRFGGFAFFSGPRLRYQTTINDRALLRLTETIRWQTNNYWDIGSRGDWYYVLNERLYFRQTLHVRWRGENDHEEGVVTELSSVLSQRLSATAGLQYDFSTVFHTQPDTHVNKYTLSLRYRKQTRRQWLYYEIAPQVSFEDEFGFKVNPGIRLRVEFFYGGDSPDRFGQDESEDAEEFRW